MQCRVVLPDGRVFVGTALMKVSPELGWFGSKALRKVHNTFNRGPIGKMHKAVQDAVGKYLPIAKPFIEIHNKLASPIHKLIEGKKVRLKATAKAIASATKDLPISEKYKTQKILAGMSVATEQARETASNVALAKALVKAKAATTGAVRAASSVRGARVALLGKALHKSRAAAAVAKGSPGIYKVVRPDGRIVNVPASKVH